MNAMKNAAVAVLAAALLVAPVAGSYAATMAMPMMTAGTKADAMTAMKLKPMIGHWTKAELAALASAKSIKVYDTKSLYTAADQKTVASAATADRINLKKFHEAINDNAGLKAWFAANKIDVDRVVGVSDVGGTVSVYLD